MPSTPSGRARRRAVTITLILPLAVLGLLLGGATASAGGLADFTASASSVSPGTSVTLTATATFDVGPTPYSIEIFDLGTGAIVGDCGTGTSCQATVDQSSPSFKRYRAYVGTFSWTPPSVGGQDVDVAWSTIAISLSGIQDGAPGYGFGLTAAAAQDVGPTPYFIQIFDLTTGSLVARCESGTTCTIDPYALPSGLQIFQAYVSAYTLQPPTSFVGVSNLLYAGAKGQY